jgi:hypothetical protein
LAAYFVFAGTLWAQAPQAQASVRVCVRAQIVGWTPCRLFWPLVVSIFHSPRARWAP